MSELPKVGDTFWYEQICFCSTGNVYYIVKPTLIKLAEIESYRDYSGVYNELLTFVAVHKTRSSRLRNGIKRYSHRFREYLNEGTLPPGFHRTEREAIESFNKKVLNEKDKAVFMYELRMKRIERCLIKEK